MFVALLIGKNKLTILILYDRIIALGHHSQVVRQGPAKPLFPGSNPGDASNNFITITIIKYTNIYVFIYLDEEIYEN